MDRNTIIAIVLSVLVWLGYFWIFPPAQEPPQKKVPDSQKQVQNTSQPKVKDTPLDKKSLSSTRQKTQRLTVSDSPIQLLPNFAESIQKDPNQTKALTIETSHFLVRLSPKGGSVESFRYKKYKDKKKEPVELVIKNTRYPAAQKWPFSIELFPESSRFLAQKNELDELPFHLSQKTIADPKNKGKNTIEVIARTEVVVEGIPLRIEKQYIFLAENYFQFNVKITNLDKQKILQIEPMLQIGYLVGPDLDLHDPYNPMKFSYFADDQYKDLAKKGGFFGSAPPPLTQTKADKIHWASIHSRYFLMGVIPVKPLKEIWADTRPTGPFHLGLGLGQDKIASESSFNRSFFIYIGEKEKDLFKKLGASLKSHDYTNSELVDSLKNTIDVHWTIEIVRDFLVKLLVWLHKIFGNYGVAVLIFAILTKVVFWPLNQKSANSMKKMGDLAPKLKELKERYKNNPAELNKRTMEIYKKHGVNPASGCLPILIQMPFFFALYSALSNSAILWNAPFIWWITDLSRPDTVFVLPKALGAINFNILPLIMVVTQFLQQKITTTSADPTQQKMLMIMPVLFIFIFWGMPSGLVLYWTVQNVLAIAQQVYTNHKGKKIAKA